MNVIRMALNFIRHHAIFPIAVIIFTFITTRYYIYDTLHSTEIHHRYWFMSDQGAQGFRRLNIAGYHYAILNFLLLLVTVTAVMSFLRMFIETVRVGNNIRSESGKLPCKFADLRRNLSHFTEAYIVAKALCFIYILNIFTWNYSELVVTKDNLSMARGILAVMALFFISFPRYFVEYKWQQCRQLAPTADKDKYGEESIRNAGQVTLARIFDVVIWFCFLQSLLYEFIKPIWTDVLKLFDRFALWFQT